MKLPFVPALPPGVISFPFNLDSKLGILFKDYRKKEANGHLNLTDNITLAIFLVCKK
jgi:hypothetical protein